MFIYKTVNFTADCKKRQVKYTTNKTWENLKTHFKGTGSNRNPNQTSNYSGYSGAANITNKDLPDGIENESNERNDRFSNHPHQQPLIQLQPQYQNVYHPQVYAITAGPEENLRV